MGDSLEKRPRARDLGIPLEGRPGPMNAITDVKGVEVGHATLIRGKGRLVVGKGPVRTGVTAILPRGKKGPGRVFAAWFSLNGNGEMTGTTWIEESGLLEGPIMLTNTHSVGVVRDSVVEWLAKHGLMTQPWALPVVAETYDGFLNDINGFHVNKEHVFEALDKAGSGPVAEGNVGGGTGMICYEFKGGIGTASRKLEERDGAYAIGVLVQANHGRRRQLRVAGVPVCTDMTENLVWSQDRSRVAGSIIIIVATDAPLMPHQLKRVARRASLGLARTGSTASNYSGDIFLAFSTANPEVARSSGVAQMTMLLEDRMDPIFEATVQAAEEAIINALVAAETMTGIDDHTVIAIPHDRLREDLEKYGRLMR
ncbi:MAG: P1 family peptidase [Deltaproteobacteria bacterium]|nr:P1 family peptidase [Deltaproteobacteria bacterium]MBW2123514.1 P1 family peptidase [Deltaproteobacteria bacterium]